MLLREVFLLHCEGSIPGSRSPSAADRRNSEPLLPAGRQRRRPTNLTAAKRRNAAPPPDPTPAKRQR